MTWRAFELAWLEDRPALDVANQLDIPIESVYVAKSRVLKRLEAEVLTLAADLPLHASADLHERLSRIGIAECLLSGDLPTADVRRMSEHLPTCRTCQAALDEQTLHSSLRRRLPEWQVLVSGRDNDPGRCNGALELLHASPPEFVDEAAETQFTAHRTEVSPLHPGAGGLSETYSVEAEIGRGGMGVVYRGFDTTLKRNVAIKILRMELANADTRRRFIREAEVIARIRHDHVVAIHAVCDPPAGLPSLVMEYLEGPTLAEAIKREVRLDPAQAVRWIVQAADGLAAVHEAGIIHRDVKPGNLMFDRAAERVKVMDFGLARQVERPSGLTQLGDLAGTPAYMSPEQVQRVAEALTHAATSTAWGLRSTKAADGRAPFRGSTHRVLQQIVDSPPRPPRQFNDAISRDLETICLKAIAKEPGRRYQTARDFASDLRRWERKEPIHARPVGAFERGWRWCRRKPLVAGLWGGLIVATGAGAAGVISQWMRAESQWHRAEEKAREALSLQAQSERDFRRARQAVDEYLTKIADDPDLKAQNFEPLRRGLLQSARDFYEEFIREHPEDDSLSAELGRAHGRIGQIVVILQSRPDSLPHFQKKQEIFERLHTAEPDNPDYADELADSLARQGEAHRFMNRMAEAEAEYGRAIELQRHVVAEHAGNSEYVYHLLMSHYKLGDMFLNSQQFPRAEQVLADGKADYDLWSSQQRPPARQIEAGFAYLNYVQGRVYGAQGRVDLQEAALQAAIDSFEKLAASPPDADFYQAALAAAAQ